MALLILLLVLAPEETTRADGAAEALAKGDKPKAIAILKEIGTLKGNDAEALARSTPSWTATPTASRTSTAR